MNADGRPTVKIWTMIRSIASTAGIACAMASTPGCFSNSKLTTAETEAYEIQEVKSEIAEIHSDSSLRPKEKEDAIRRLQERLDVMAGPEGRANQQGVHVPQR